MPNDYNAGRWAAPSGSPYPPDSNDWYESIKRSEYVQLRKHANSVGICFIVYFVLQYVLSFVLMLGDGLSAYQDSAPFSYAVNAIYFSVIALFVPFLILSFFPGSPRYIGVLPFSVPKKRWVAVLAVLAGFGVCMFSNYAAGFVSDLIRAAGLEETDLSPTVSTNVWEVMLNVLCTAAIPACVEEFVFRGVILQPLRRYGEHFAVFSSAFLFALAHGTVTGFVFAFLVGLALGYTAVLTGSLWPGIVIHFLNNFYATVITDLDAVNAPLAGTISNIIVYAALFLGTGSLVFLVLSRTFRFEKSNEQEWLKGKRLKGLFLSVPLLLSIGAFLFHIIILNLN